MRKENPASKLHNLLEIAYKFQTTSTFRTVWSNVYDIEPSDTSAMLLRYNEMLQLFFSTKDYIETTPRLNTERNMVFINKIGHVLAFIDFNSSISQFKQSLDYETLTALYYLAENISLVHDLEDSIISDEQINELIEEVDTLISHITESDLSKGVKEILVKNLHNIRESLHRYFISGIEGVQTALEQSLGSLIMNNQDIRPEVEDENVRGVFKFMGRLNEIISTANGVKDFIAPITKFFINE
ncbi:hypothetical protein Q8G35_12580 [Peribacillus simplex]|uniref:Uncharacterized protein n=2 Tax=Peribacillus TaxID=2675229 RepID=A0AA90SWL4_9BACI|nr:MULTISPECIES: hypothetical protein [Peribacillus]MDP1419247.1 hypothetical protein [Peribacillus simplex]MDP1452115.1 hypothetical protein [Peribacillus frigoritolerans]